MLLGGRRGAHGAGAFASPEASLTQVSHRLALSPARSEKRPASSAVFAEEGHHFVSRHHRAEVAAREPQLLEPEKCEGWDWYPRDDPTPAALRRAGEPHGDGMATFGLNPTITARSL